MDLIDRALIVGLIMAYNLPIRLNYSR